MSLPHQSSLTRAVLGVGFVCTANAIGFGVAELGEDSAAALALLLVEPAIWVVAAVIFVYALTGGRWVRALAMLLALLGFAAPLRLAPVPRVPTTPPDAVTPLLRECVAQAGDPGGPLRIATWNTGGLRDPVRLAATVHALGTDVTVLQEVHGEALLREVVAELERTGPADHRVAASEESAGKLSGLVEGVYVDGMMGQGTGLLVRGGFFGVCGEEEQDSWSFTLPAASNRRAVATLAMPRVEGVGWVPVLAVHADRPAGPTELGQWGERIVGTAERVAAFSRAIDAPGLVVLGDMNAHVTFPRLAGVMAGAGLAEMPAGATWPARVLGLPALPLYAIDRAWYGAGWRGAEARAVRMPSSDHLALVALLKPRKVGG